MLFRFQIQNTVTKYPGQYFSEHPELAVISEECLAQWSRPWRAERLLAGSWHPISISTEHTAPRLLICTAHLPNSFHQQSSSSFLFKQNHVLLFPRWWSLSMKSYCQAQILWSLTTRYKRDRALLCALRSKILKAYLPLRWVNQRSEAKFNHFSSPKCNMTPNQTLLTVKAPCLKKQGK